MLNKNIVVEYITKQYSNIKNTHKHVSIQTSE